MEDHMDSLKGIWAVGGGKGGVGKSFIVSAIGTVLARQGNRVLLIDADLGGATLHHFLGMKKAAGSLSDFFDRGVDLEDLVVNTSLDGLNFIRGHKSSLGSENITYTQKNKFLRHLKKLADEYLVLVDLGAGSSHNIIDTFLTADLMTLVIVPEIISVENMYSFLKNALFRRLVAGLGEIGRQHVLLDAWKRRHENGIKGFKGLISRMGERDDEVGERVRRDIAEFKIHLIVNQARNNQEAMVGNAVKSVCLKYFGINTLYSGYVEHDEFISRCVNRREIYLESYPASRCAREIERLTKNLLEGRQISIIS